MANARRIEIELPLPHKDLTAQRHVHWRDKMVATKAYRGVVAHLAKKGMGKGEFPLRGTATLTLHFYLHRIRPGKDGFKLWMREAYYPRDGDNARASFKAGQDGLVDAGLIVNDSAKYLICGPTYLYTGADAGGRACVVAVLDWEEEGEMRWCLACQTFHPESLFAGRRSENCVAPRKGTKR